MFLRKGSWWSENNVLIGFVKRVLTSFNSGYLLPSTVFWSTTQTLASLRIDRDQWIQNLKIWKQHSCAKARCNSTKRKPVQRVTGLNLELPNKFCSTMNCISNAIMLNYRTTFEAYFAFLQNFPPPLANHNQDSLSIVNVHWLLSKLTTRRLE